MGTSEILLLLFIINLGTAFGAGLYETRIVLPMWFGRTASGTRSVNFEAMRSIDTGRKFWGMVTTLPLTLLTIANFILAYRTDAGPHSYWLAAAAIVLFERIGTFAFFMPTAIKLQKGESMPPGKAAGLVSAWISLNHMRNLATLSAFALALKALMML